MGDRKLVYSAQYYDVYKELPENVLEIKGEPMNWLVINRHYGTVEATVGPYPHAVMIAKQFDEDMQRLSHTTGPSSLN